ncbi:hypothetical protein ACFU3J_05760 [Streptomyces sp. NPDC057411]|uniref:hypothetical protein n=1 Tax=unclassified Streptomyces TaxID=2593676 RepID=UPI0036292E83
MNGIAAVLDALREGERHLTAELLALARRHRQEHEIHHVATDLAHWSAGHDRLLEEALDRFAPADQARLSLLEDLRALHLAVAGNLVYWQMLTQAAAASRDARLTELVEHGRPHAERQLRWTETMIKNLSAQLLTVS